MRARRSLIAGACLALLLGATPAWATVDNLKSYKAAYPGKEPKAYSCKACHEGAIGKKDNLNAYGAALQKFKVDVGSKKLTVEDYQAFDAADEDGDGATNLQELEAGTDVSDPASTPAPAETPAAPAETGGGGSSSLSPSMDRLQAYLDRLVMPEALADEPSAAKASQTQEAEAPTAEYVGMETCAACHAKQYEEFKQSTHARITIPGDTTGHAQGCEMCHGPGSLHAEAGGGRGVGGIINPRKDPSTCFACHLDKKMEFRLPYHHPVMEGKMSCADCHNAHGEDIRPWSATSLKDINEACFKCHKEQRGPFVWEHEALREGCTSCHKVHGSIHEKMLAIRDYNLCLRCHTQANFPTIGKRSHATYLPRGTCFSAGCHTAVHGSNFDDHLRY
jgi:predicted CXXCH cytochrome family protein